MPTTRPPIRPLESTPLAPGEHIELSSPCHRAGCGSTTATVYDAGPISVSVYASCDGCSRRCLEPGILTLTEQHLEEGRALYLEHLNQQEPSDYRSWEIRWTRQRWSHETAGDLAIRLLSEQGARRNAAVSGWGWRYL